MKLLYLCCSTSAALPLMLYLYCSTSAALPLLLYLYCSTSAALPLLLYLCCSTSAALLCIKTPLEGHDCEDEDICNAVAQIYRTLNKD